MSNWKTTLAMIVLTVATSLLSMTQQHNEIVEEVAKALASQEKN